MGLLTRRQFFGAAAGLAMATNTLALPVGGITINPRSLWGSKHPPKGPLPAEDVKFLLVHHSASRNGHTSTDVPGILRSWFDFHTGPDKGWNDIAYNFVIDSEGVMWEGRHGSLAGAVAGDATGGNQGFTQLVCLIGDFNTGQPTPAALSSLNRLLAWLADRHGVATSPGSQVTFTSRGSNKWPAGTEVSTATITGHREMSKTSCPGNNLYPYVVGPLMADVHLSRGGGPPAGVSTTSSTSTTTAVAATTTTAPSTSTAPPTSTAPRTTSTTALATSTTEAGTTTTTPSSTTSVEPSTTTTIASTANSEVSVSAPTTTIPIAVGEFESGSGVPALLTASAVLVVAGTSALLWRQRRMRG